MPKNDTADRIAAAALAILIAEGADAVTMRRVAADAQVTTMATYRHFPNRETLLRTVADEAFAELGRTWGRTEGDFDTRFFGLLNDFLDFALAKPNLYSYLMTEPRTDARRFPRDYRDAGSPAFAPVVETVEQGIAEGVLRPGDPLEIALGLVSQVMGLAQLYIGGRIGLPADEFRAFCVRSTERLLDGFKA